MRAIAAAENAASIGEESRVCKDVRRLSLRAAEALRGGEAIAVLFGGLCLPGGDCFASLAMTAMNGAIAAAENAASIGEESRVCKDVTRLSLRAKGEAIAVLSGGLCLPGRGLLRFARNDSDERGDYGSRERCFASLAMTAKVALTTGIIASGEEVEYH
jgi:hypothetical protein